MLSKMAAVCVFTAMLGGIGATRAIGLDADGKAAADMEAMRAKDEAMKRAMEAAAHRDAAAREDASREAAKREAARADAAHLQELRAQETAIKLEAEAVAAKSHELRKLGKMEEAKSLDKRSTELTEKLRALETKKRELDRRSAPPAPSFTDGGLMTLEEVEKLLKDKEVVELIFGGPSENIDKVVEAAVKEEVIGKGEAVAGWTGIVGGPGYQVNGEDITITQGRPNGLRGQATACIHVSEAGLKRLRAVHEVMAKSGYAAERKSVRVWRERGDEKLRAEARKLVGQVIKDFGAVLDKELPGSTITVSEKLPTGWLGEANIKLSDGKTGVIRVSEVTNSRAWLAPGQLPPEQWVHFPKLGLVVTCHRIDGQGALTKEDAAAVRTAFDEAITPWMKRDPEVQVRSGEW